MEKGDEMRTYIFAPSRPVGDFFWLYRGPGTALAVEPVTAALLLVDLVPRLPVAHIELDVHRGPARLQVVVELRGAPHDQERPHLRRRHGREGVALVELAREFHHVGAHLGRPPL